MQKRETKFMQKMLSTYKYMLPCILSWTEAICSNVIEFSLLINYYGTGI